MRRKLDLKQMSVICKKYTNGISCSQLAKDYKLNKSTVYYWLNKNKIPLVNRYKRARKYIFNFDYFREPLDEHRAYWLGFFLAESSINIPRTSLKIDLSLKDITHLKKLKTDLDANVSIKIYKNLKNHSSYCSIQLCSKEFVNSLKNFNIVHKINKKHLIYPRNIPKKLQKHFWRGMIDGDGSLFKKKPRLTFKGCFNWCINLAGSKSLVKEFRHFVNGKANIYYTKGYCSFAVCGKKAVYNIIPLLYKGATIYLERKYKLFLKIMETSNV